MNFSKLLTVIFNDNTIDTGIAFLQNNNVIKVSETCENGHTMFIRDCDSGVRK